MPIKDFMLLAMLEIALTEADAELIQCLEKKGKWPKAESYQALEGDVLRKLRKKISDLPGQLESVYQGEDGEAELKENEREELSQKVVNKLADPMECARLLQASRAENEFIERRFANVLSRLKAPPSDEKREKAYADWAKKKGKDELSLEEMLQVDMALQNEIDVAVQTFYAEIISVTTGLRRST